MRLSRDLSVFDPCWVLRSEKAKSRTSVAEEFLDGLKLGFGHVQIFLGALEVIVLPRGLRLGEIGVHARLGGDDISAQAVACSGLLALESIEALNGRGSAAVQVIRFLLDFLSEGGVLGRRNGVGARRLRSRGRLGGLTAALCAIGTGFLRRLRGVRVRGACRGNIGSGAGRSGGSRWRSGGSRWRLRRRWS